MVVGLYCGRRCAPYLNTTTKPNATCCSALILFIERTPSASRYLKNLPATRAWVVITGIVPYLMANEGLLLVWHGSPRDAKATEYRTVPISYCLPL